MRTLNHLTSKECIVLAQMAFPSNTGIWVFKYNSPEHTWQGFDFVCENAIFQIDFRKNIPMETNRFRLYLDLNEVQISERSYYNMFRYLEEIGVEYPLF